MSWDDDDDWESTTIKLPGTGSTSAPTTTAPIEASDDEEELVSSDDEAAVESSKPKKAVDPNKVKAKAAGKAKQKQLEAQLAAEAEAAKAQKAMTKEEKVAEKLRLQKLVEDADLAISDELFNIKKESGVVDIQTIQTMLQTIPLDNEAQYKDLAEAVGKRVELEDKPQFAKEFLKEIGRAIGRGISGDDLAEVISVLGVVKNEKIKQQLNKKKKKTGKAVVNVSRHDNDFDMDSARNGVYQGGGRYDDIDGDFM